MVLLTFAYVIATIWLVRLAQKQVKTVTDLERSRTRPFIIFDLVVNKNFVFATIKNTGLTPAKDVRITVSPNIEYIGSSNNPDTSVVSYGVKNREIPFIAKGIAMLPPQKEIEALMGFFGFVRDAHPELQFQGKASYYGTDGVSYLEPFIIDLSARDGILQIATKDIEDVAKQLESIASTLDRISTGSRQPLIRTITDKEYQAQEQAAIESLMSMQSGESPPEDDARRNR